MSLLDFVGGGLPFASEAVVGFDEGRRERDASTQASLLAESERRRRAGLDQQAAELHQLKMDQMRQELKRSRVEGKMGVSALPMQYDPVRGVMINRQTGEVVTPQGLPERPQTERAPRRQVVGGSVVDVDTGTATPITGLPEAGNARVTATTRAQLADNAVQLDLVRRAREGVRQRPQSVGLRFGSGTLPMMGQAGEMINQRLDPEGVPVRQLIAQISAQKIKDLSGAAVTISEFPRLAAFVPLVWDTPEKIQANLNALERELEIVMQALENGVSLDELIRGGGQARPTPNTAPPAPPASFDAWRASRRTP